MKTGFLAIVLLGLAAVGCGGDDSGSGGDPVAVKSICEKVVGCGGWGWTDQAECEANFVGNEDMGTACQNETGYRACMADCLPLDCEAFRSCEGDCWEADC